MSTASSSGDRIATRSLVLRSAALLLVIDLALLSSQTGERTAARGHSLPAASAPGAAEPPPNEGRQASHDRALPIPAGPELPSEWPADDFPSRIVEAARGSIGNIEMPTIRVSVPLYEGVTPAALRRGPGHWPGTPMPGHLGNVVIGGHRTTFTRPFRDIDRLAPGDPVIFVVAGARHRYRVTGSLVVPARALWITDQTARATATLFACHPLNSARQRYVVRLEMAPPEEPAPRISDAGQAPPGSDEEPLESADLVPYLQTCSLPVVGQSSACGALSRGSSGEPMIFTG